MAVGRCTRRAARRVYTTLTSHVHHSPAAARTLPGCETSKYLSRVSGSWLASRLPRQAVTEEAIRHPRTRVGQAWARLLARPRASLPREEAERTRPPLSFSRAMGRG